MIVLFYHVIKIINISEPVGLRAIVYDRPAGVCLTPGVDLETDRLSVLEKELDQTAV